MFKPTIFSSLITLSLTAFTSAAVVNREFVVANARLAPAGTSRDTVVVNGQFPGPLLSGNIGDNFQVNVQDELTDTTMRRATSIHWHGLFQAHSNEMDGPSWVNQCPIVPNESFLYDFTVPDQSGTYWYHSHLSTQYCDGLRGPIVIYDPEDPHKDLYDVDDETTILSLGDWYNDVAPSLLHFPNPNGPDPIENATTINGLGRVTGGPQGPISITNVTKGSRYRFRIINMSCGPTYTFSIDGHNMTIIEADGVETQPYTVDQFDIYPAQRYSVVVNADQDIDNYWIRVIPSGQEKGDDSFGNGVNGAILRYVGADVLAEPTTNATANPIVMNEANLAPLVNPGAPGDPFPGGADVQLEFTLGLNLTTGMHTVNGTPFIPPTVPVLLQILSGTTDPADLLPAGSVYSLPSNKTIEVNIPGFFPHPFHLHGHTFDVVRVAGQTTPNYVNPPRRDTVNVGLAGDNVTFRFVTDNPGPWFLHCHIDWHLEAGLAIVFAEDVPDVASANPVNTQWQQLCPNYAQFDPDSQFEDDQFSLLRFSTSADFNATNATIASASAS